MVSEENSILQVREEGSVQYRRAFLGCEMVDWLVNHGEVRCRRDGDQLCKAMLEHGIVQHGVDVTSLGLVAIDIPYPFPHKIPQGVGRGEFWLCRSHCIQI